MTSARRRAYIDAARGIAVLLMFEAHTADAWTRPASRATLRFRDATVLGGFAAPLFLWLAGLALVLSAERIASRPGATRRDAFERVCRRGLEIFVLAFLFRVQAFVLSPGGPLIAIFRVDILNVMGLALAAAAAIWFAAPTTAARVAAFSASAATIALITPVVRAAAWVDAVPVFVQWYVRPAGEHTTFTLLPWAAFVWAGAAAGVLLARVANQRDEGRIIAALGLAGAALVAIGFVTASRPTIYSESSFWTSSPTWFAIRVGVLMLALAAIYVASRRFPLEGPLTVLGRNSLFVYWIHVELVYGYASWLWRGRLPLWGTAIGCAAFSVLMYCTVPARDRIVRRWSMRRGILRAQEELL